MVDSSAVQPVPAAAEGSSDRPSRPLGLILTVVIAVAAFIVVALLFHSQYYKSPAGTLVAKPVGTVTVNGRTLQHVTLAFNTYPDSTGMVNGQPIHPGGNPAWPAYGPTNQFQVPAHALVTVTVRQYDSGGALNNPFFATVCGTVGGVARINGKLVHSIDPNNAGHTFTVRGVPGTDPGVLPQRAAARRARQQPGGQRPVRVGDVQLRVRLQGHLRLELRVPVRHPGGRLRGPDVGLRVHVGVHPCRLRSTEWKKTGLIRSRS